MRILILLAVLLVACHGQKKHDPIDTSPQREEVKKAADGLNNFPQDSKAGPKDTASVKNAKNALDTCYKTLESVQEFANDCDAYSKRVQNDYDVVNDKLRECRDENSFWSKFTSYLSAVFTGIIIGVVGLFLFQRFGALAIATIKSRIPL